VPQRVFGGLCSLGVAGALEALEAHCAPELNAVLSRYAPAGGREDVLQHVRLQVLAGLESYSGRGSLRGWVRIVATRAAIDLSRASATPEVADGEPLELPGRGDLELELLKARYRGVFEQALREAGRALSPRERTLLRQHYLDELSIDALGRLYAVHRSSAARWVVSARQRLVELTRAAVARHGSMTAPEVDSLVRLMHSELRLSLSVLDSTP
jgi:RNA polymerase sigma-70 factor, ECF subfamily